jgi:hypothetical protein
MRKLTCCTLLTLVCAGASARAQVNVQTPWAGVQVGTPAPARVLVQTPWGVIAVNPPPRAVVPAAPPAPGAPVYVPGEPPPVPLPIPVEPASGRVPTLSEFAATFTPKGGHYEVVVEHPITGKPVKFGFSLPDGTPRRVRVHRNELEFEYRGKEVSIRFLRGGEVRVRD